MLSYLLWSRRAAHSAEIEHAHVRCIVEPAGRLAVAGPLPPSLPYTSREVVPRWVPTLVCKSRSDAYKLKQVIRYNLYLALDGNHRYINAGPGQTILLSTISVIQMQKGRSTASRYFLARDSCKICEESRLSWRLGER